MSWTYVIGTNAYDNCQQFHTRSNGSWHAQAQDLKTALRIIFGSMPFPTEATGRHSFVEGISIHGKASYEVIQVWSNAPGNKKVKDAPGDLGLLTELHISQIENYVQPKQALLGDGTDTPGLGGATSPLGSSVAHVSANRERLQHQLTLSKFQVQQKSWELEQFSENLKEQRNKIDGQLAIANVYLQAERSVRVIAPGNRAPADQPYKIFQNRQFLHREIGLLANLVNLDFRDLRALDKWLVKSGQIWKFLPFDKTILVTQPRDTDRDYGDPYANWIMNVENKVAIIWIRDGQRVSRLTTEIKFNNAVFPHKNQAEQVHQEVLDKLWKDYFEAREQKVGLRKDATESGTPYDFRYTANRRFKTLQDWLDSAEYSSVQAYIGKAVFDYLREKNQQHMTFLVMLQGLVDRKTDLLNIPSGTDLFNPEVCAKYFELIFDYSHGLPDSTYRNAIAPYLERPTTGEWIVACYVEYDRAYKYGSLHPNPTLYKVLGVTTDGKPIVGYHKPRQRGSWKSSCDYVKKATPTTVEGPFVKITLSTKLASQILDDRAWKIEHSEIVAILAHWRLVLKQAVCQTNSTKIKLPKAGEDDE